MQKLFKFETLLWLLFALVIVVSVTACNTTKQGCGTEHYSKPFNK